MLKLLTHVGLGACLVPSQGHDAFAMSSKVADLWWHWQCMLMLLSGGPWFKSHPDQNLPIFLFNWMSWLYLYEVPWEIKHQFTLFDLFLTFWATRHFVCHVYARQAGCLTSFFFFFLVHLVGRKFGTPGTQTAHKDTTSRPIVFFNREYKNSSYFGACVQFWFCAGEQHSTWKLKLLPFASMQLCNGLCVASNAKSGHAQLRRHKPFQPEAPLQPPSGASWWWHWFSGCQHQQGSVTSQKNRRHVAGQCPICFP